jgi:hypothetical protein
MEEADNLVRLDARECSVYGAIGPQDSIDRVFRPYNEGPVRL